MLGRILLCAALVAVPLASPATTSYARKVPYRVDWFPTVYIHTGESIDIYLQDGDVLESQAIASDPRWHTGSVNAGPNQVPHIIVKPSRDFPTPQLMTIPTSRHDYHVLLASGNGETSTYTLIFQDVVPRPAAPAPAPTPRAIAVSSCAAPLDSAYRVTGDHRIVVDAVCDDGLRTYILMRHTRPMIAAVPYRVDPGGHQDQIVNPGFNSVPDASGHHLGEWVLDGVFDHIALVADSSRGQLRKNIDRVTK